MSLVVGLMSAFVPTAGAMAVDWSGPRTAKPDTTAALAKASSGDLAQASEIKPLRFAEGGLGRYRGSIDWFEWGNPGTIIPAGGMTQTNTREVADGTLETTCTVGAPTGGPLRVQRPGTFEGDGLDDLYNIGGTGLNNQLASGLANQNGGDTVTFDFDCSVTLDGVDVPLAGLVMADAEASDQSTGEYVQATAPQGANWRIIDRYRPSDCGTNAAIVRTGNTLRMAGAGTPSCSTYPTGVAFMEGASSAVASVYGAGRSAIALGVMLFTDFGDAPESYGDAGSLYSPGFTGTTVAAGQSTLFGPALSTVGQPATRLGAAVTSEQASQPSSDAAADADDAVAAPGTVTVLPGSTYTLPGIACTGPGYVNGWIDFNGNGTFDENEGAEPVACAGGTVSLTWTVPADAQAGPTFMRLRIGATAADVSSPTGVTTAGEVEDYPLTLQVSLPFECTTDGYLFQSVPEGSGMFAVDLATGDSELLGNYAPSVNAVGYNPLDGFFYGWSAAAGDIVRIDSDLNVTPIGVGDPRGPANSTMGINTGDIDEDGQLYITGQLNNLPWYQIDLEPGSDTYGEVVAQGTRTFPAGVIGAGPDWSWIDGYLYFVTFPSGTATTPQLLRFDPTTSQTVNLGALDVTVPVVTGNHIFGATYADADGNLYASHNGSGVILRIDVETLDVVEFATGPSSTGNDGARCAAAPVPIDLGDAPESYGTLIADDGARHAIPGYAADTNSAPVMLGDSIDVESDGQPSADALGDDENGVADEDGVAFNPDLGYSSPTLRTGLDPVSLQPLQNTLEIDASADGFVSAWVDWNQDGAFTEDERVANAQPVTAGVNDVTFSQGTSPASIDTMVRVRYSTDAASIATPTGAAPDGEVEDYQVLIERLVTPDVCTASGEEYYAFTYRDFENTVVNAGAPGSVTRYEQVSVVGGVPVDMVVEVLEGQMVPGGSAAANGFRIGEAGGVIGEDDARWQVNRDATIRYTFVEAGTDDPVAVNAVYTVSDMDSDEVATFSAADLAGFAVTTGSAVEITEDGDQVLFAGNGNWNGDPQSRFQFVLEGLSTFDVRWQGFTNSGFGYDGDGDLSIDPPACSDFGDAPDSYGTTPENDGASHLIIPGLTLGETIDFDTDGQPTDDALGDDETRLADEDGVADPIVVTVGEETDVTVSVTNDTDEAATLAGWIDLDGNGSFDADELVTLAIPADSGTADYVLTFPAGTVTADTYARFRVFPGAVDAPLPTGAAAAGEVEDYVVTVNDRELEIEKSSDMTVDSRPGDEVTYTVTVTNTGSGDYTDEFPAVVFDDLSGVLDDATYNGDATAVASDGSEIDAPAFIPESFLSWSGPLAAGESVTIEYTVTLTGGGDGTVRNVAWQPPTPPPPGVPPTEIPTCDPRTDEGTDPVTGEACGIVVGELPKLSIAKTSDSVDLPADGGTVTYTVTVTNEGPGDFTAEEPATMTDDLSDVLDDAVFGEIIAPASGAVFDADAQELTWAGPLAAGETVDITYTVTYDATTGDNLLVNVACVPEDLVLDPDQDCQIVQVPGAALTMDKTVDPADGTVVVAGQEVTYTLTFTNVGQTPAAVDAVDDLSGVLDDATLTAGPTAQDGLTATLDGDQLAITGSVPVGETRTVTYTVTVDDFAGQDDHVLGNVLGNADGTCPPGGCPDTENPIRHYTVEKEAVADAQVNPGDVLSYTVTVTNDGGADYTVDTPAAISDDLSAVLDDATYNGDAVAVVTGDDSIQLPAPTVDGTTLDWAGPIAVGQTVTITYSVTVNDPRTGDGELTNAVLPNGPGGECAPDACLTETPLQFYTVAKAASATTVIPGDTITYTVTVTNGSAVDYTADAPASFEDDLSAVLDDATYNDDATNGAVVDGSTLSWSGAVAAGESVTITYSVTVNDPSTGDDVLTNAVVPTGPGGDCLPDECGTETPVRSYSVTKEASAATVQPGDVVTYTVTVTNTGAVDYTDEAPASLTDDLSAVLDDATYNDDATSGAVVDGETLSWHGALPVGETVTITYSVTVNAPNTGDGVLTNAVVPGEPGGSCEPAESCTTTTDVRSYTVSKTASSATVQPGDTITYEVVVTNTGNVDYTEDAPASFTDDLSEVLDDASYNDDATEGATVSGSTLFWEGALAVGETVTITYSVTVNSPNTGDDVLTNAVVPNGPGGTCDPDAECITTTPIQSFSVTKSADATDVVPGDVITYTLTVVNTGQAAYTADSPASLTDDMSAVLDDATYNGDATNGAVYDEPTLSWEGPLEIGETVTITYSVTVNDPATGDGQLDNAVVTENGGNCEPGSNDPDCIVEIPSGSYTVSKEVSATTAMPGDVITYTVTVTNTGDVAYTEDEPASFEDNLANVLDDATYNDDASNGAVVDGTTLSWEGPLAVGGVVTITYSVTVNDAGTGAGDRNLGNVVVPTSPGGDCLPEESCETNTPIGEFEVSKTSSGAGEVLEGDVITYTITVANTSEVDFTADEPASFTDDLSAVLDDATYNDDATNGATVDGDTLSWEGPLAAGESIEITYSVTVGEAGAGDGILTNGVVPGDGGACVGDCTTEDALRAYTVTKTSSAGGAVVAGDIVTYTVTVTNTGAVDYTEDAPASLTDDLSAVLDDATYNGDATNGATVNGSTLTWSGPLAAGESIEISYSVTVGAPGTGDGVLTNVVVPTVPGGTCDPAESCIVTDELQAFTVEKSVSSTVVYPGDELTYTITVTNVGAAAFTADAPAVITDDLSEVLDDADYNGDATNGAVYTEPELSWALALEPGETVVLTYSVTVHDASTGDLQLRNAVDPSSGGECVDDESCDTETLIASYAVEKVVDTASSAEGDTVTYTITVTNTGAVDFTEENPASFTDDLSEVLDDAVYNDDATNGAVYSEPVLSWEGAVEVGGTVTVTYSVTVNAPATGDRELLNAVEPGLGGSCGEACMTTTDITDGLPATGLDPRVVGYGAAAALAAILAGLVLLVIRRRQTVTE